MERDEKPCNDWAKQHISTHTLTWSVTKKVSGTASSKIISTHTLTWSVTTAEIKLDGDNAISTHTLTWSVTGTRADL